MLQWFPKSGWRNAEALGQRVQRSERAVHGVTMRGRACLQRREPDGGTFPFQFDMSELLASICH